MQKTAIRIDAPSALLVALDDRIGGICFDHFDAGGTRIVAVRAATAATSKLATVMPAVVVIPSGLAAGERAALKEHIEAVGAELVVLPADAEKAAIRGALTTALALALRRREAAARTSYGA